MLTGTPSAALPSTAHDPDTSDATACTGRTASNCPPSVRPARGNPDSAPKANSTAATAKLQNGNPAADVPSPKASTANIFCPSFAA